MGSDIPSVVRLQELQAEGRARVVRAPFSSLRARRGRYLLPIFVGTILFGITASLALSQPSLSVTITAKQDPPFFVVFQDVPQSGDAVQLNLEEQTSSSDGDSSPVDEGEDVLHGAPPPEGQALTSTGATTESPVALPAVDSVVPVSGTGGGVAVPMPESGEVLTESQATLSLLVEAGAASSSESSEGAETGSLVVPRSGSGEGLMGSGVIATPSTGTGTVVPMTASGSVPSSSSSASSSEVSSPESMAAPLRIGVYLTEGSVKNHAFLLETLDRLKAMTGAALVFNVKAGYVHFDATAPFAQELNLVHPSFLLSDVLPLARERGIYTIGRFLVAKDPDLAQALPETQIRHPKTGRSVGNVWVDPAHLSVLKYDEEILEDLVRAGIDEVNFDYIRYPTEYLQSNIGLLGQEKADHIETFLKMARAVVDRNGGRTKIGISTYAILGWNFPVNFEAIGQDFVRFSSLVDIISPMAYPATFAEGAYYNPGQHPGSRMYYLVYRTLMGYRDLLGTDAYKLRPWIQGYGITAKNLRDEIQGVFDGGACGFTIWNASNVYDLAFQTFPSVRRPEYCTARSIP